MNPHADSDGIELGALGALNVEDYVDWRENLLFMDFCMRPTFANPDYLRRMINPPNSDDYWITKNDSIWHPTRLYAAHDVHIPNMAAPDGSIDRGRNIWSTMVVPNYLRKGYFVLPHMLSGRPYDTAESAERYHGPPGYFDPKLLGTDKKYKMVASRLRDVGPFFRWNAHNRHVHRRTLDFYHGLLKAMPQWRHDPRVAHLWRQSTSGAYYLQLAVNGFGMVDARIFETFFLDIKGFTGPEGSPSIEEIYWVAVHCRFKDATASYEDIKRRCEQPKARFMFVVEALAYVVDGQVADGAFSVSPDFRRRLSTDGVRRNSQYDLPVGFFGASRIIGFYIAVGTALKFVNPADVGVRMSVERLRDPSGPVLLCHRTVEDHIYGIIHNDLGRGQQRLPMLAPAPSGVDNGVFTDGGNNEKKYGWSARQHYVTVDAKKWRDTSVLTPLARTLPRNP